MMPILHCPGVMTPGQFGPTSRHAGLRLQEPLGRAMSRTGMPSVMATMSAMPASAASMMASAAPGGRHEDHARVGPGRLTASATVLNTGSVFFDCCPVHVVPPPPGVTPPTNFVP